MKKLDGKTALITGGSSGIGLATAKLFLSEGAKVVVVGRNKTKLEEACRGLGSGVTGIPADVANPEELGRLFDQIKKEPGHLDVVFANAGFADRTPWGSTDNATFDAIWKTNVAGVFFTIQGALPLLRTGSSIIITSSIVSSVSAPGLAAYCASKAAVNALARSLATDLDPAQCRVNVVMPGGIQVRDPAPVPQADEEYLSWKSRVLRAIPMGRFGDPEEVAKLVLFLASDESAFIHASEIAVDGGQTGAPHGAPAYREHRLKRS